MTRFQRSAVGALALAAFAAPAHADDWRNTMVVYLLGAGLDGETQLGPVVSQVDQSFSEILDHLDMAFMGTYFAQRDALTLTLDAMYFDLKAGQTGRAGVHADIDLAQTIAAFDVGYRVAERLEVLGGLRYNSLDLEATVRTPAGVTGSRGDDKDWIDPYLGLRSTIPFNDAWSLTLRGDIGGFDVGSKLAWQAVARINWTFSPTFLATFGYRILDTDYEDSSGGRLFRYDMAMSGPVAGFGWSF